MPDQVTHEVIVACVDGSPEGYMAVAEAAELARVFHARLIALSVAKRLPKGPTTLAEVDEAKRNRDEYLERIYARTEVIATHHDTTVTHEVRFGRAADVIVSFARDVDADLVVLGQRRRSRILGAVGSSTAHKVSDHSTASVLIVKGASVDAAHQRLLKLLDLSDEEPDPRIGLS
ncbi:MAG TPA: universal stress protein [Candidatus Acidoferrales bacterium]|nr:universal stress protein [Candidatus Acidoferrales bacterium]